MPGGGTYPHADTFDGLTRASWPWRLEYPLLDSSWQQGMRLESAIRTAPIERAANLRASPNHSRGVIG
jgi:hypothetical protein